MAYTQRTTPSVCIEMFYDLPLYFLLLRLSKYDVYGEGPRTRQHALLSVECLGVNVLLICMQLLTVDVGNKVI